MRGSSNARKSMCYLKFTSPPPLILTTACGDTYPYAPVAWKKIPFTAR